MTGPAIPTAGSKEKVKNFFAEKIAENLHQHREVFEENAGRFRKI